MPKGSVLFALLEAEDEPTQRAYVEAVEDVIRDPRNISGLMEESFRDDVLIILGTESHRLANFFERLRAAARQTAKSQPSNNLAAETITLLVCALPHLHRLVDPEKVLNFLIPAIDVCLDPTQRPVLHKLASVLGSSGTLLEYLVSNHVGVEIIRQWASMQSTAALDTATLELWTDRLMSLMSNCAIDHDLTQIRQKWHMLKALKSSLQSMEHSISMSLGKHSTPTTHLDLPALGSMRQLKREDKKVRFVGHQHTSSTFPSLKDEDKHYLKALDLHVPGSKNSLQEIIGRLEREKTTAILIAITSKLPCYLCISSLASASETPKLESHNESFHIVSSPQGEIIDKAFGVWEVLLSLQALRSLLHLGSHGQIAPYEFFLGIANR